MASRCSLAKTHRIEIRKALAVIRRSKTSRKQVCVKWVVGRDSNFSGLVFGLLTFSGESAAEYAANSLLLRKRRPSSPPVFGRGGEKPQSQNRRGGESPAPPSRFQQGEYGHNFFRENLWKKNEFQRRKKLSKMVPK